MEGLTQYGDSESDEEQQNNSAPSAGPLGESKRCPFFMTQSCHDGSYICRATHAGVGRNNATDESIPSARPVPQSMGKATPQALPSAAALLSAGGIARCLSELCSSKHHLPSQPIYGLICMR